MHGASVCVQLIVAAEACSLAAAAVPPDLLACTVPSLLTLACAAPAPHAASAAALLATALLSSAADLWRPHLGDLQQFTDRCAVPTQRNIGVSTGCTKLTVRYAEQFACDLIGSYIVSAKLTVRTLYSTLYLC